LRWATSVAALSLFGSQFPWGTLIVNVVGSFLIGLYFTVTEPDGRFLVAPATRQAMLAGFCGGFTTFSAFSLETVLLIQSNRWTTAAIYIGGSLALWLIAVWAGHAIGLRVNQLPWRQR